MYLSECLSSLIALLSIDKGSTVNRIQWVILVSQKNSMSPSNGERGQSTASMAAFSITTNAFIINIQMHKMKAL